MSHDEVIELLPRLVHGRLDEENRRQVDLHVAACHECTEVLKTLDLLALRTKAHQEGVRSILPGRMADEASAAEQRATRKDLPALEAAGRPEAPASVHLTSEEIVSFALDKNEPEVSRRSAISGHVEACASCRSEMEVTRQAEQALAGTAPGQAALVTDKETGEDTGRLSRAERQEADPTVSWPGLARARGRILRFPVASVPSMGWIAAAAAAGLVLLLLYPASLGIRQLPAARSRISELEQSTAGVQARLQATEGELTKAKADRDRIAEWGGMLQIPLLRSGTRGKAPERDVRIGPDQPTVPLAVEFSLPGESLADSQIVFRIKGDNGAVLWESKVQAAEALSSLRDSRSVLIIVPARKLGTGRHRLLVYQVTQTKEVLLTAIVFTTVRAS